MSKPLKRTSCQIDSVLVGAVIGFLAFVMLIVLGEWSFAQAVFAAGVVFVAATAALLLFLCKPLPPLEQIQKAGDRQAVATAGQPAKTVAAAGVSAAEPVPPAPAAPAPAAPASAGPATSVKTGTLLEGEKELATRKGEWTYSGQAATEQSTKAEPVADAQAVDAGAKPQVLQAARGGQADDLKLIKGVGPKLETLLHDMGFFHFDQIADWSAAELAWVDENLTGFRGRASRDGWVEQARALAADNTSAS